MRLKLYRAAAMADAMRQIRAELGPEAMILSSRRIAGGIEVTACLETPDAAGAAPMSPIATARRRPAVPEVPVTPAAAASNPHRLAALAFHGVPAPIMRKLAAGPLAFALSICFRFAALPISGACRPLLLVGPPGAGKTLTTVRLATRLVMTGATPLVITADTQRAGASEQLAAFTRLLGLTLIEAADPASLALALRRHPPDAPVLIDAPGSNPFDPGQCESMAALAHSAGAAIAVVLPAGMDPAEAADIAAAHAAQGATLLVATRLDVSRRLGSVLAAAEAGLALTEAGIGPGAADGLAPLTADMLAQRLLRTQARPEAQP